MRKLTGVLVLEGPDGAGKTTLAEELCRRNDGHYVHRTWRKGMDVWDHHTEALQIANERAHEQLVVIDRLWPSEAIYGRVFRGESDYKHNSRCMDRVLLRMAAIYVLCVPRDKEYIKKIHGDRAAAGGEMYSNIDRVVDAYVDWMDGRVVTVSEDIINTGKLDIVQQQSEYGGFLSSRSDRFHYDVTRDGANMNLVCEGIEHTLAQRQSQQWSFALDPNTPNVLGHAKDAEFLFVGEQVGDLHAWSRWPFYARSHSPDYINRSLHEFGFNEKRGAWTNAWDEDNRLPHIYGASPHLKVIALGRKAERRCEALRIPVHASLPHPSWARRFNHHGQRGTSYPQLLLGAINS